MLHDRVAGQEHRLIDDSVLIYDTGYEGVRKIGNERERNDKIEETDEK